MNEVNKILNEAIDDGCKIGEEHQKICFERQIKGLILILQQNNRTHFISKRYVIEKLNMILNGGIGFHPSILEKLDG